MCLCLARPALLRDFCNDWLALALERLVWPVPLLLLARRRALGLFLAGEAEAEPPAHSDQDSSLRSLCAQSLRPVGGLEGVIAVLHVEAEVRDCR
jgi:hypothetical protein